MATYDNCTYHGNHCRLTARNAQSQSEHDDKFHDAISNSNSHHEVIWNERTATRCRVTHFIQPTRHPYQTSPRSGNYASPITSITKHAPLRKYGHSKTVVDQSVFPSKQPTAIKIPFYYIWTLASSTLLSIRNILKPISPILQPPQLRSPTSGNAIPKISRRAQVFSMMPLTSKHIPHTQTNIKPF